MLKYMSFKTHIFEPDLTAFRSPSVLGDRRETAKDGLTIYTLTYEF